MPSPPHRGPRGPPPGLRRPWLLPPAELQLQCPVALSYLPALLTLGPRAAQPLPLSGPFCPTGLGGCAVGTLSLRAPGDGVVVEEMGGPRV